MSTAVRSDLAAAIEAAKRPLVRPRLPPADLPTRLKTSPLLRRALPRGLVLRRASAKGERLWSDAGERERAIATMEQIVAGTPRAAEVSELARRRLVEEQVTTSLFWQPWRDSEIEQDSREAADRALGSGRRVLISLCHLGPYFLALSPLDATGLSPIAAAGSWFFAAPEPGLWGRRLARWWQGIETRGERLIDAAGSFEALRVLIEDGEVILVYFDLPGSLRTDFLGKPVMLASGTSQLAHQTDALVLPLRARREGSRVFTDVWEALDPREFPDAEALHRALAAVHERSILEMPETLEAPGRPGAWEDAASTSEWARPARA
jgi:hypothetical protein